MLCLSLCAQVQMYEHLLQANDWYLFIYFSIRTLRLELQLGSCICPSMYAYPIIEAVFWHPAIIIHGDGSMLGFINVIWHMCGLSRTLPQLDVACLMDRCHMIAMGPLIPYE